MVRPESIIVGTCIYSAIILSVGINSIGSTEGNFEAVNACYCRVVRSFDATRDPSDFLCPTSVNTETTSHLAPIPSHPHQHQQHQHPHPAPPDKSTASTYIPVTKLASQQASALRLSLARRTMAPTQNMQAALMCSGDSSELQLQQSHIQKCSCNA
jgi:hypothetical protein